MRGSHFGGRASERDSADAFVGDDRLEKRGGREQMLGVRFRRRFFGGYSKIGRGLESEVVETKAVDDKHNNSLAGRCFPRFGGRSEKRCVAFARCRMKKQVVQVFKGNRFRR